MRHDAFVSYASSDRLVAYRMVDYLESCGIRCWVAPRDVPGGRNYAEAILSALNEVDLFLLIFSEESNSSEHVQREVERALHLSKPIVPVRIRNIMPSGAMDYYLATLHWLDAFCTESGDASDGNAQGVELGCQDVTRAVASLLGREEEVEKAIAEKLRAKEEAEERRRVEAEEREMRIRLEAEAHAQAELEAAAKAKAEIEAEDRRILEAEERQRKAEQEQRERDRERQKEEREREQKRKFEQKERERLGREKREREKEKKRAAAAAAGDQGAGSSSGKLVTVSGFLLALLIGGGWWAFNHFNLGGKTDAQPSPLVNSSGTGSTDPPPAAPVIPERVASVRASFSWAEQQHFVATTELLKLDPGSNKRLRVGEQIGERLEIKILPGGEKSDEAVEASFELEIPGFSPVSRQVNLGSGEQDIDFGSLVRLKGEVRLTSAYADQPRAAEAHNEWLKGVHLEWKGVVESDLEGIKLSSVVAQKVAALQSEGPASSGELTALTEEELAVSLGTGSYAAYLETACQAPFDRVQIASVDVTESSEPATVVVPIVPVGGFGGLTQWTSTSIDSTQDDDGDVTWNFYNLPEALDLSSDGPRMVLSYVDIVEEGTRKKTIYLPAPVTAIHFDPEKNAWILRADPKEIVRTLVDDDLSDRYFEAIEFSISHHADKRTLLFDVETVDQPLNATKGTPRAFPLTNAYPVFAESVKALDASQPGFGVIDLKAVYQHIESISSKDNAEDYRRTLTMPFASSKSLEVDLGVNPDRQFSGSGSMRIDAVESGSPAASAGLKAGDLVVGISGREIGGVGDFYRARFELPVGSPVEIKVLRDGREIALAITPKAIDP